MSNPHRQALDLARAGHWHEAHELIQEYSDPLACLIHGYLHIEEGDTSNAHYWYTRAKQKLPEHSQQEEFDRLYELAGQS